MLTHTPASGLQAQRCNPMSAGMRDFNWMSLIYLLLVLVLIAPAALRLNRGRMLPTIAAWLAVLAGLMFVYETFGPF
jgi:hypothetical protein